jgi:5-methylcytosine-specific restriction endonuclease McrA
MAYADPEAKRENQRRWRAANPERTKEYGRQHYARHSERRSAYNRRYHAANRERRNAGSRRYRAANIEREKERQQQYGRSAAGLAKARKYASLRRARKRGATHIEHVDPLVVLELHDGVCGICGEDVDPFDYHVDHIVPLSRGGYHNLTNSQPAHPFCNISKGCELETAHG